MMFKAAATAVSAVMLLWFAAACWVHDTVAADVVPHISADVTSGPPGTPVTLTGTGFCSTGCTTVTIAFNGFPADKGIQVAPDGSFRLSTGVSGGSGTVEILATQQRNPPGQGTIQAFTYFTVTPGAPPPGSLGPGPTGVTTTTAAPPTSPRTTTTRGSVTTTSAVSTPTTTKSPARSSTTTSTAVHLGLGAHAAPGSGGLPPGAIAGIVAATIAALAGLILWLSRRRRHA